MTLKFLSRTPCKQQLPGLLVASPKALSVSTPKTPARTPLASRSPAFFSGFEHADTHHVEDTPRLEFGSLSAGSRAWRARDESVSAQQDLAASVRPVAESARQYFLARQEQRGGEAASAGSQAGLFGPALPTLLRHPEAVPTTLTECGHEDDKRVPLFASARKYAERAHASFLDRQAAHNSDYTPERAGAVSDAGLPTILNHGRRKENVPCLPVLLGHADADTITPMPAPLDAVPVEAPLTDACEPAEMARHAFLLKQQRYAGRTAVRQVP